MIKTSIQHEKLIFAFLLKKPEYLTAISKGFFQNVDLDKITMIAQSFYKKYGESPSCEQMRALVKDVKDDNIDSEIVNAIYDVDIREYDNDWLRSTTEAFIRWKTLTKKLVQAVEYTKLTEVSIENVEDVVNTAVNIVGDANTIEFDKDLGLDFFDSTSHRSVVEDKMPYTWEYFNKISHGGLDPKTLNVYLGQTNVGKSIVLCNDAASFVRNGKNVVYITLEMSELKAQRRIAANLFDVTMEKYDEIVRNGEVAKRLKKLSNASMIPLGRLFVKEFPTSQAGVTDIKRYLKELEEVKKIKIDVVLIDYINILKNERNPNSENTYMKIKQVAEDLRGLAVEKDFIIISATQVSRGAYNGDDIKLEDVSESVALNNTCDTILGIIQTPEMYIGDLEDGKDTPQPYYWIKILKIREGAGKNTKFRVNINYDKMKLTEKIDLVDMTSHI